MLCAERVLTELNKNVLVGRDSFIEVFLCKNKNTFFLGYFRLFFGKTADDKQS